MATSNAALRCMFLGGAALGALAFGSAGAFAQTPPTTPAPAAPAAPKADVVQIPPKPAAEAPASQEKIIVTGSRIARDQFTSVSPIQVITAEAAVLEGMVDTAGILQGSTIATGSVQLNNQFGGFVVEGGPGINSISLRGLGAQRSLVLLNGERPGPAGVRGQVGAFDLNVIPSSIIQRVEILKDGASSIYGSDAVAGVANIITRTNISKFEISSQYNATEGGGGETWLVNAAWGHQWKNGSLTLAAEYEDRDPLHYGDRNYLRCQQDLALDRTTGARIDRFDKSAIGNTDLGGCTNIYFNTVINLASGARYVPNSTFSPNTVGPLVGYHPRANRTFTNTTTGYSYYEDILNDPRFLNSDVIAGVKRESLYGRSEMNFDILGGVDWTTEAIANRREYDSHRVRQFFPVICGNSVGCYDVPATGANPFGATSIVEPVTIWPSNSTVDVNYFYINSGLKGKFGGLKFLDGWTWDINASYSKSDGVYRGNQILKATAGDANYPGPDGLYRGPTYNAFDPAFLSGNIPAATFDLLNANSKGKTTYDQTVVSGVVSGDILRLPAGPLGVALGAEYRTFSLDDSPDKRSVNNEFWGTTSAGRTKGSDTVSEAFVELNVPVVKGLPGVEEFTVNGSARAFHYDSYGSDSVWKAGFNWQVIPMVRIRGTKGTSYRAPALYELYLANQTGFLSQLSIDPCIDWGNSTNNNLRVNCAAAGVPSTYTGSGPSATITSGGGKGILKAETSNAQTLGIIFTPSFIDLSVAVDYFDIDVRNAVTQLGASTILGGCYGATVYPNAFCSLFTRNSATAAINPSSIVNVKDNYINANQQSTRGIDISARYSKEFNFGKLTIDVDATKTLEDVNKLFSSSQVSGFTTDDFNGTIGDPEWVGHAQFSLKRGDFTYSWFVDYIGPTDNSTQFAENITYQGRAARLLIRTDDYFTHDASVRWVGDRYSITAGLANIFNTPPPRISNGAGTRLGNVPLFGTQYDLRGRQFFVRLGAQF